MVLTLCLLTKLLREMIILFALCGNYQIEEEQFGDSCVIYALSECC